jgi:hypothetical protein
MKKSRVVLATTGTLFLILMAAFFAKVGWVQVGAADLDMKRMGYCFDVATDENNGRLYVAAGERGVHIFNLLQGELQYVSTYYDDGYYRNLKISGDRAFIADSRRGLVVLDIRGPTPTTTWIEGQGPAYGLHIQRNMAYVAAYGSGLKIFDIGDPDQPVLLSTLSTGDYSWDVWVDKDYAYLADFNIGVSVVDISSPTTPRLIGSVTWGDRYPSAEILRGEGDYVYVAASGHGLVVVDVSDPSEPVVAAKYRPLRIGHAEGLAVRNGIVYLAQGSELEWRSSGKEIEIATTIDNGLHIIDAADPQNLSLLSKVSFLGWVEGVHLAGNRAYVSNAWNGVRSIDISDPSSPSLVDSFESLP